jgi:hypothetical protein
VRKQRASKRWERSGVRVAARSFSSGTTQNSADKWVAAKQAKWLEKVLAEEHERDGKHADRIELPD